MIKIFKHKGRAVKSFIPVDITNKISWVEANKSCFDCCKKNPEYISINNGIFLCSICAEYHYQFPKEISKIIKNDLKLLSKKEIKYLENGGNNGLYKFMITDYPTLFYFSRKKIYITKALDYYREKLRFLVEGGKEPTKPSIEEAYQIITENEINKNQKDNGFINKGNGHKNEIKIIFLNKKKSNNNSRYCGPELKLNQNNLLSPNNLNNRYGHENNNKFGFSCYKNNSMEFSYSNKNDYINRPRCLSNEKIENKNISGINYLSSQFTQIYHKPKLENNQIIKSSHSKEYRKNTVISCKNLFNHLSPLKTSENQIQNIIPYNMKSCQSTHNKIIKQTKKHPAFKCLKISFDNINNNELYSDERYTNISHINKSNSNIKSTRNPINLYNFGNNDYYGKTFNEICFGIDEKNNNKLNYMIMKRNNSSCLPTINNVTNNRTFGKIKEIIIKKNKNSSMHRAKTVNEVNDKREGKEYYKGRPILEQRKPMEIDLKVFKLNIPKININDNITAKYKNYCKTNRTKFNHKNIEDIIFKDETEKDVKFNKKINFTQRKFYNNNNNEEFGLKKEKEELKNEKKINEEIKGKKENIFKEEDNKNKKIQFFGLIINTKNEIKQIQKICNIKLENEEENKPIKRILFSDIDEKNKNKREFNSPFLGKEKNNISLIKPTDLGNLEEVRKKYIKNLVNNLSESKNKEKKDEKTIINNHCFKEIIITKEKNKPRVSSVKIKNNIEETFKGSIRNRYKREKSLQKNIQ